MSSTDNPQKSNAGIADSYDAMPYISHPFPQATPECMHAEARYMGLNPPELASCRVLEIGSASGGNLIPFALRWPASECVGIDLSAKQISDGMRCVTEMQIPNCKLEVMDILDMRTKLHGSFDYIICHGVFSWIPEAVRLALMDGIGALLSEHGVAYVSYNTLPGWHLKNVTRDLMRFHAAHLPDMSQRVQQARAFLEFAQSSQPKGSIYGTVLTRDHEGLKPLRDDYIGHEYLEDFNHPMYFKDFVALAQRSGLEYLQDSNRWEMSGSIFSAQGAQQWKQISQGNWLLEQQYLDFVTGQQFRRSLLVKGSASARIQRNGDVRSLRGSAFFTNWKADSKEGEQAGKFMHPAGGNMSTPNAAAIAIMNTLIAEPRMGRADLGAKVLEVCRQNGTPTSEAEIDAVLNKFINGGIISLYVFAPLPPYPPERPKLLPLARWQVAQGQSWATSATHAVETVANELTRLIWQAFDGERTFAEIRADFIERVANRSISIAQNGAVITDSEQIALVAPAVIDQALVDAHRTRMLG
jgi:SAM-dependent methyltransferase